MTDATPPRAFSAGPGKSAPVTSTTDEALTRIAEALERLAMDRPRGCICPKGAEQTCKGLHCPRRPPLAVAGRSGGSFDAGF